MFMKNIYKTSKDRNIKYIQKLWILNFFKYFNNDLCVYILMYLSMCYEYLYL